MKKNKRFISALAVGFLILGLMLSGILLCRGNLIGQLSEQNDAALRDGENGDVPELVLDTQNEGVTDDAEALDTALTVQRALRNVGNSVLNSVVSIRSRIPVGHSQSPYFNDEFFRYFFGNPNQQFESPQTPQYQEAFGSGFIITEDGYILTNNHVVNNASEVIVNFLDDTHDYPAEIIGTDEKTDLALIKISTDELLVPTPLGDSDEIEIGDFAIAIGNPFGLSGTMTFGIISAINRENLNEDADAAFKSYIQTDAPINQGNSGGPLLNINGQVIGVNTMIYSQSGGSIGIGFAIPINIAKYVAEQLITNGGIVQRGYLGVFISNISPELASHFSIEEDTGVFIESVIENSPADEAGIREGDIVISIDGKHVSTAQELQRAIGNRQPGQTVEMDILRNDEELTINVLLGSSDAQTPSDTSENNFLGMTLTNTNSRQANELGIDSDETGVAVIEVDRDSQAYRIGIRPGDIIRSINSNYTDNMEDFQEFISENEGTDSFLINILRSGRTFFVVLQSE